nr:odorant receptor Or1-like [Leptinotarsa decemlineata]
MTTSNIVMNSFKYNILFMKICGLYPSEKYGKWFKFYAFLFYFVITLPAPLLPITHLVISRETDMEKVAESMFVILVSGTVVLKFLPFKFNPDDIKGSIFALNQDIFTRVFMDQEQYIRETEAACRKTFVSFMTCYLLSLFTWPIRVLIRPGRKFPIEIWLPFNPFERMDVYVTMFAYIVLATGNAPVGNASIETLIGGLINHAACQIRILKDTLQNLSRRVDEHIEKKVGIISATNKKKLKNYIVHREICHCVKHYDAIYNFVRSVENTFAFVILNTFAVSCVVVCMTCFQLSLAEPFSAYFFAMVILIIALLLQIGIYCYYGTVLYEESDTINFAIYSSDWYNFDEKSKKALIILMERTKRPMLLMTGKILDLSLTTWIMIIRRSYSLLAVLQNY